MTAARYAVLLAALYAVIAGAYIWFSGAIAARFAGSLEGLARIERLKGLLFVATTALLLGLAACLLFRRMARMIEERERLRQAVIVSQARVVAGEMAAAVAHDFNNALLVIQHSLETSAASEGTERTDLTDAAEALRYARQLSRQLAKTARGERQLNPESCDFSHLVRTTVGSLSRLPRLSGRQLDLDLEVQATAVADTILFEQILSNLLLNAADAATRIRVVLKLDPGALRLEVHDDGPGIPADRRGDVFSAFETSKPDGLGLGLLSVRVAVEMQGGSIALEESPLGGAAFVVRLPRSPPSGPSAPTGGLSAASSMPIGVPSPTAS